MRLFLCVAALVGLGFVLHAGAGLAPAAGLVVIVGLLATKRPKSRLPDGDYHYWG